MTDHHSLSFIIKPISTLLTVFGRDAWTLEQLLIAGERGCTPLDNPALWSAYVFNLRKLGLEIEMVHKTHTDQFQGNQARYILRSQITILQTT